MFSGTLISSYQVAEISLYELGLYSAFYPESEKAPRLNALYACLLAVKSFLNTHFSPSASLYPSDPYVKWVQMGYVLLMGFKLCVCDADGWDFDHARKILDFTSHLNILIGQLELLLQLRNPSGRHPTAGAENASYRPDIFSRFLRQTRRFKAWYESMVAEKAVLQAVDAPYPTPPSTFPFGNRALDISADGFGSGVDLMNIDEVFWQDLMSQNDDWSGDWYPDTM